MFGKTVRPFYYGDGTENIVFMTKAEAEAANLLSTTELEPIAQTLPDGGTMLVYAYISVNKRVMRNYQRAAEVLNTYLDDHAVYWTDTSIPMLRPVE